MKMINWKRFSLTLLLTTLALSTFADGEIATEMEILKFKFIPQEIRIKTGDTGRWTNREKRQYHSIWFEQADGPEPDYFFLKRPISERLTSRETTLITVDLIQK